MLSAGQRRRSCLCRGTAMKVPASALGREEAQLDSLSPSGTLRTPALSETPPSLADPGGTSDALATASRARRGSGVASWKLLIPNAVTLANITFGFLGILTAAEGRFQRSVMW